MWLSLLRLLQKKIQNILLRNKIVRGMTIPYQSINLSSRKRRPYFWVIQTLLILLLHYQAQSYIYVTVYLQFWTLQSLWLHKSINKPCYLAIPPFNDWDITDVKRYDVRHQPINKSMKISTVHRLIDLSSEHNFLHPFSFMSISKKII